MGKPKFGWEEIPLSENMNTKNISIDLLKKEHGFGFCVNIGNPHIIFFVKDCHKIDTFSYTHLTLRTICSV